MSSSKRRDEDKAEENKVRGDYILMIFMPILWPVLFYKIIKGEIPIMTTKDPVTRTVYIGLFLLLVGVILYINVFAN